MANIWGTCGDTVTTTLSSQLDDLTYNMRDVDCRLNYLDGTLGKITARIEDHNIYGVSINQEIKELNDKNDILENEVKELKKIIARLNTRVNNLIAEKQINDYNKKE